MTLLLRMLAWPVVTGLGFAFVVWVYELTDATATWREIDETAWLSQTAWFAGPALAWVLVPAGWGRPRWAIWSLAAGGVAIFAVFAVLIGLFAFRTDMQLFVDFSAHDLLYLYEHIGDQSVEKGIWLPEPTALYLLAGAVGYAVGLGMISRLLAAIYIGASAIGSIIVYVGFGTIGRAVGDLMIAFDWEAGLGSALPLALAVAAVAGLFGAAGILIWAMAIGPAPDDEVMEIGEQW